MKPWCGIFRSPDSSLMWATLLYASRHHPDETLRQVVLDEVEALVEPSAIEVAQATVRKILANQRGTPLEPFIITKEDAEFAARLVAISLTGLKTNTRFRIVSRDTFGVDGGLVLTSALKSYFVARYGPVTGRRQPKAAPCFAPREEPMVEAIRNALCPVSSVSFRPDQEGLVVAIDCREGRDRGFLGNPRDLAVTLRTDTVTRQLKARDLKVTPESNQVFLRPASAEALMWLSAAANIGALVDVTNESTGTMLVIRLHPISERSADLSFAYLNTEDPFFRWLRLPNWPVPSIVETTQIRIGQWLVPQSTLRLLSREA